MRRRFPLGTCLVLLSMLLPSAALAARGATPSAFERRCIPSGGVAPPSNIPDILGRYALPAGRIAALGATMELPHGLLAQTRPLGAAVSRDVAAGQRIFDAQCAWCHGAGGSGGTGPDLRRATLRHAANDATLVEIVRNGIPGTEMPSFAIALTDTMAWQTGAYVRSLGRARTAPVAGDAQRGARVYETASCASCHVVSGRGGVLGPELTSIGALRGAPYLRDAIVKPAAAHPPGYLVVRAVPNSGAEVRGIRVNEDVFWIHIRDAGGIVQTLQKSELSRLDRELDATMMPSYETRLAAGDLDDLVAYLVTLRGVK